MKNKRELLVGSYTRMRANAVDSNMSSFNRQIVADLSLLHQACRLADVTEHDLEQAWKRRGK